MGRARKSKTSKRDKYASFGDMADESDEDADLPKDEAGRRKIKRQYGELLGIRIEKLRGRILNRERINRIYRGLEAQQPTAYGEGATQSAAPANVRSEGGFA